MATQQTTISNPDDWQQASVAETADKVRVVGCNSGTVRVMIGASSPNSSARGHDLNTKDNLPINVGAGESVWVKGAIGASVVVS